MVMERNTVLGCMLVWMEMVTVLGFVWSDFVYVICFYAMLMKSTLYNTILLKSSLSAE